MSILIRFEARNFVAGAVYEKQGKAWRRTACAPILRKITPKVTFGLWAALRHIDPRIQPDVIEVKR